MNTQSFYQTFHERIFSKLEKFLTVRKTVFYGISMVLSFSGDPQFTKGLSIFSLASIDVEEILRKICSKILRLT